MSITRSVAAFATVALLAVPSAAVAVGPPTDPGAGHRPAGTPTPPASPSKDHPTAASNPGTDAGDTPGRGRARQRQGEGIREAVPGREQEARRGREGNGLQPMRDGDGQGRDRRGHLGGAAAQGSAASTRPASTGTPFSRCVAAAHKLAHQSSRPGHA